MSQAKPKAPRFAGRFWLFALQLALFLLLRFHPHIDGGDDERTLIRVEREEIVRQKPQLVEGKGGGGWPSLTLVEAIVGVVRLRIAPLDQFFASSMRSASVWKPFTSSTFAE